MEENEIKKVMKQKVELPISMYLLMFLQILMTGVVAIKVGEVSSILALMYLGI